MDNDLIKHMENERFTELKNEIKRCTTNNDVLRILNGLKDRDLKAFAAWLEIDIAAASTTHTQITGIQLGRARHEGATSR